MDRRQFLFTAGMAGLTASYKNISFGINYNNNPNCTPNENSVVYLFLSGGPTHIETFNPIPDAPVDRRSIVGYCDTPVLGMRIGGLFKELAGKANKYCIVNSFAHNDPNHESAQHWMMTGEKTVPMGPAKWPSYGSVVCGQYGTNTKQGGLPTYVKLNANLYDGAAWMGSKYMGYAAAGEGVKDLIAKDIDRFKQRLIMLETIDKSSKIDKKNQVSKGWTDLRNQAVDVLIGNAGEAFVVEKDKEFNSYKDNPLGRDLLTSIRLIERGVKFITLNYGGWDMHNGIEAGLKDRVPPLDHYISKFLDSLSKRELNTKTMLVISGDFGRTPKINKDAGRDHWPGLVPLFIACDNYEMGRVIGTSDSNAERADQNPFEPEDLKWTIFDHLGIHKSADWYSIENRPMPFVKDDAKNILKVS